MEAKLIVVRGKSNRGEVLLRLPCVIGRNREADLTIAHPMVSRRHCELSEKGGKIVVRDLKSLNGTLINGKRVNEAVLPANAELTVGPLTFRVEYGAARAKPKIVADDDAPDFVFAEVDEDEKVTETLPAKPKAAAVDDDAEVTAWFEEDSPASGSSGGSAPNAKKSAEARVEKKAAAPAAFEEPEFEVRSQPAAPAPASSPGDESAAEDLATEAFTAEDVAAEAVAAEETDDFVAEALAETGQETPQVSDEVGDADLEFDLSAPATSSEAAVEPTIAFEDSGKKDEEQPPAPAAEEDIAPEVAAETVELPAPTEAEPEAAAAVEPAAAEPAARRGWWPFGRKKPGQEKPANAARTPQIAVPAEPDLPEIEAESPAPAVAPASVPDDMFDDVAFAALEEEVPSEPAAEVAKEPKRP